MAERGGNPGDGQTRPLAEGRDAPRVQPGDPGEAPTRPAGGTPDASTQPQAAQPAPAASVAPVPYEQQQQYPAQYQYPGTVEAPKTNGMGVAGMVLGILGILCSWVPILGIVLSVLALIFGMVGKNQIDGSGGTQAGGGMAVTGIVLGWIGIGIFLLFLLFIGGLAGCGALLAGSGSG